MDRDELGVSTVAGWPSSEEAEEAMAGVMRTLGFRGARATRASRDGGIDVMSEGGIAQVKMHRKATSRPDIQTFVGAANDHPRKHRLFFAAYGYTAGAKDYADRHNVALFEFDVALQASPTNRHAHALSSRRELPRTEQKSVAKAPAAPDPTWIRVVAGVLFAVSFLIAAVFLYGIVASVFARDDGTSGALAVGIPTFLSTAICARFFFPFMMGRRSISE